MHSKGIRYIAAGAAALAAFSGIVPPAQGCCIDAPLLPASDYELQTTENSLFEVWNGNGFSTSVRLLEGELDQETQWEIYRLCGYQDSPFCFLMAIASRETGFDPQAVGDNGNSKGMMQINTRWHTGRMETLGVTDLTDPIQCAAVAMDYLKELEAQHGFPPESEALLMAYNMGPGNAKKAINAGNTSTEYSREAFRIYQGFMKEMECLQ